MVVTRMQAPSEEKHISMWNLSGIKVPKPQFLILISKIIGTELQYSGYIDHQYYFDKSNSQKFLMGVFA